MLQSIRETAKGGMAIFIVAILIIPFALFGVDSLFLQDSSQGQAAKVNDESISEVAVGQAVRVQKQQLLDRFGDQVPADLLSDERLRGPVLQRLIQRQLLSQSALEGDMIVSDTELDRLIIDSPQFQRDSQFDPQLFTQLLRMQGYTPLMYKNLLIDDILVNQHASAINDSAFITTASIEQLAAITQQERDFQYVALDYDKVASQASISEEEVQSFYEENQAGLMTREEISVEYIEVKLNSLAAAIKVSEEDIVAQFKQDLASFEASIQRQAAHILIEPKTDGSDQTILQEIQSKLASGEAFDELAKQYSDDLGSKAFGGDLGITDGSTFPEAFETALASLDVGEVSEPVTTDSGIHLIKLISEQSTEAPTLDGMRTTIAESLSLAEAEAKYLEAVEALPELTYNADSLEYAANDLELTIKQSQRFGREGGSGLLGNNQVVAAIFHDDFLINGQISDVIEVSDTELIVLKLKEHLPPSVKPLESVREDIVQQLTREQTEILLRAKADKHIQTLNNGADIEALARENNLEWQVQLAGTRQQAGLEQELLQHIFSLPHPESNPITSGVQLDDGNYLVVQLTKVVAGQVPAEQLASVQNQLAIQQSQNEFALFQMALEQNADIKIY